MGKFYTYRGTTLLSTGTCPDGDELIQGGFDGIEAGAGDPPPHIKPVVKPVREPTYDMKRKGAYPNYGEQLDMLWHAMDIGQIPKAQQFYNAIKAVKDKYPKGGQ
jgi:hypothetical protein